MPEPCHLLEDTGFDVVVLYGDFERHPFGEKSPEPVWVMWRSKGG